MKPHCRWVVVGLVVAAVGLAGSASGRSWRDALRDAARQARTKQQSDQIQKLVDERGEELNRQLVSAAGSRRPRDEETRVVPLVVERDSRRIGVAQVCGPADAVAAVQAVVAQDVQLQGRALQGRVLIPADTGNVAGGFRRVPHVGVTATLDYVEGRGS